MSLQLVADKYKNMSLQLVADKYKNSPYEGIKITINNDYEV